MEKVLETNIKREKGFMYFCKDNPVAVYKAQMGRKKKEEPKVKPKDVMKVAEDVLKTETKDVVIEKQQPTVETESVPEPITKSEPEQQTPDYLKEAKIEQLENQMKEIAKTIEELKPRPDNEFKAVDSVKELEEKEGKPKRKRFGLFRRK